MSMYLVTATGKEVELRHVLSSGVRESLEGEKTLTVSLLREYQKYVSDDVRVRYGDDLYDITKIRYSEMGQYPVCALDCEHTSYRMNTTFGADSDISGTAAVLLDFILDGTGFTGDSTEVSGTYSLHVEGQMYRRNALFKLAALTGTHVIFSGTFVSLVPNDRADVSENILNDEYISTVAYERNLLDGTTSYDLTFLKRPALALGDRIAIRYTPLGLNVTGKTVIGLEYDPYDPFRVTVDVGDYIPDIVDDYIEQSEKVSEAVKAADSAEKTAEEVAASLEDCAKKSEISAEVNSYLNSETGQASIVASLSGTYVTEDKLSGYVEKTSLSAEIGAYIDTEAGTAKIVNKLTGTFVKEDTLGNYVEKTELSTEIGAYIDTSAGTAKIISAAEGTYQKKSDMSGYVTTTNLSTSIAQYIDSSTGQAKIVSACSGTYITESDLSGYAKTSAVTAIEQSVSDVEAAITMSSSYSKNTIGTNVYALLQLVTNANSSSIKIQADKIDFTGFTTFVRASDLGASGSTSIDGGRITTGTISADRIDTSSITLSDVYGKGTYADYLMITSSGHYMYIGSDITTTKGVYESIDIRSNTLGFSNTSTRGLVIDHANKVFRPNSSSTTGGYSLGTSTYRWNNLYVTKIYLNGTELTTGANPDMAGSLVKMGGSSSYYIQATTSRQLCPSSSSTSYPCYLGTASLYWHYAYIGSNTASIGSSASSKVGFFGTTPVARKTVSSSADVATLITALKAYGLIA